MYKLKSCLSNVDPLFLMPLCDTTLFVVGQIIRVFIYNKKTQEVSTRTATMWCWHAVVVCIYIGASAEEQDHPSLQDATTVC